MTGDCREMKECIHFRQSFCVAFWRVTGMDLTFFAGRIQ